LTFIADHILSMKQNVRIGWIGRQGKFKDNLIQILKGYGLLPTVVNIGVSGTDAKVDVVIVRNEISRDQYQFHNIQLFHVVMKFLATSKHDNSNLKFIFTDVVQTRFEGLVRRYFDCSKTPYSARILSGVKRQDLKEPKQIITRFAYMTGLKTVSVFGVVPLIRIWFLGNRFRHKRLFSVARWLYRGLSRLGFFK